MRYLVAVWLLVACVDMGPKPQIEGAVPYTDNTRLSSLWTTLEACSGLSGDLSNVRFYTATSIVFKGGEDRGLWVPDGNRIYILASQIGDDRLMKHEMMHALLRVEGHPTAYFTGTCGNLM